MKYFKAFILLGLLFGSVVLVSSTVEAEKTKDEQKVVGAQEANHVGIDDVKQRYCGCCRTRPYGIYRCGPVCCWQAQADDQPQVVPDEALPAADQKLDGAQEENHVGVDDSKQYCGCCRTHPYGIYRCGPVCCRQPQAADHPQVVPDEALPAADKKLGRAQEANHVGVDDSKQYCGCCRTHPYGIYRCGPVCCRQPQAADQPQVVPDEALPAADKKLDGAQEAKNVGVDDAKQFCGCCRTYPYGIYRCGLVCCRQPQAAYQPQVVPDKALPAADKKLDGAQEANHVGVDDSKQSCPLGCCRGCCRTPRGPQCGHVCCPHAADQPEVVPDESLPAADQNGDRGN